MKRLMTSAVCLTVAMPSFGQQFAASTEAAISCGTYLQSRKSDGLSKDNSVATEVISAWVKGYVSGFTRGTNGPQIAAVPEGAVVVAYLDKFCRDNPLKFIGNGAFELVRDLGGKPR